MPENLPGDVDPDTVEDRGFSFSVPDSKPRYDYKRIGAGILIGLAIVGIFVFSLTDLSSVLLPMDDRYLQVLVPETEDGAEAIILSALVDELDGNTLSVSGTITNNAIVPLENVMAVVAVEETTGRFPANVEVPIDPLLIEPGESGTFSMSVTLPQKPHTYRVRFQLQHGPFVPHRDERAGPAVPQERETIRLNIN